MWWFLLGIVIGLAVITIADIANSIRSRLDETHYRGIPPNELIAKILSKDTKRVKVGLKKKNYSYYTETLSIEHPENADVQVEVGQEFSLEI